MTTLPRISLQAIVDTLNASGCTARLVGGDVAIQGMTADSRKAAPGCLFVCKGAAFKPAFLQAALTAGAAAYLCDEQHAAALEAASRTVLEAKDTVHGGQTRTFAALGAESDAAPGTQARADAALGTQDHSRTAAEPAGGAAPAAQAAAGTPPEATGGRASAAQADEAPFPSAPRIVAADVRRAMALAAAIVYDHPDARLRVIGITGTKGKSTTAYMLRSIFQAAGVEPSILGSIETDDGIERCESRNTTPEAPELWRRLRNTEEAGRDAMIMEVSSQGLKYDRVLGLRLDTACFLNIGRDHISPVEHSSFEDYFASKLRIFEQCRTAVVNLDSDHADRVLEAAGAANRTVTFGIDAEGADYRAKAIEPGPHGIAFELAAEGRTHRLALGMAGAFNVSNALAAIAMARLAGVGFDAIAAGLAHVRVPGRMELVASEDGSVVAIVDYAHNELSFRTLFASVAEEYPGRTVIAVFGAPGGKAQERRVCLPRVAAEYADLIVYTEEDPAHERVEDICAELAANTPAGVAHEEVFDREAAVRRAFEAAGAGPAVVLLLAKGDETRQHRGDEYPEVKSDLALAREILGA